MYIIQSQRFTTKARGSLRKALCPHDFTSRLQRSAAGSASQDDRLLRPKEEPPLGAHLVTPRFAYEHHGVYVGRGMVVHYSAFAKHWRCGPVEEISLTRFADRRPVWIRPARKDGLTCAEIVRRARTRVGENRYRFFSNNCEHLSEWCVNDEHRSPQVERLLARVPSISAVISDFMRLVKTMPLRSGGSGWARPTKQAAILYGVLKRQ